jgi:hypothetical protein
VRFVGALTVLSVTLLVITTVKASVERNARVVDSSFTPLPFNGQSDPAAIRQVVLKLPSTETPWVYQRAAQGWRIPEFKNGYAQGGAVEGIIGMLLSTVGRQVGNAPGDSSMYGFAADQVLGISLRDETSTVVDVTLGGIAPGVAKDEAYAVRLGDNRIFALSTNPRLVIPLGETPPMLDTRVFPQALQQGAPNKISISGTVESPIREIAIKALPVEPEDPRRDSKEVAKEKEKEKKPTHEYTGVFADGHTQLLDDKKGQKYVSTVLGTSFDALEGDFTPDMVGRFSFDVPYLQVVFAYENAPEDTIIVSASTVDSKRAVLNKRANQVFFVSEEKVQSLIPRLTE